MTTGGDSKSGERRLSVFLNVPFDAAYQPVMRGLVFACVCCGYRPRCAVDCGSTAIARMDRIAETLVSCKYSIHDLSRCRGEGDDNLARFNMPLELGMACMLRRNRRQRHDWLFLVSQGHDYRRVVSDLSGHDPKEHNGTVSSVIPPVMAWLVTRPDAIISPRPDEVVGAVPQYDQRISILDAQWGGHLPWVRSVLCAVEVAEAAGLIPHSRR